MENEVTEYKATVPSGVVANFNNINQGTVIYDDVIDGEAESLTDDSI